jgi:hypothetical protein
MRVSLFVDDLCCGTCPAGSNATWVRLLAENYFCGTALEAAGGRAMGKFFLIIIAISVAILLAMSAYIISL